MKATLSRKAKVGHLAGLLRVLSREELPIACRLVLGRVKCGVDLDAQLDDALSLFE